jgi:integrase
MRTRLTPAFVAKATAMRDQDRTIYWDEALRNFGLVVTAKGARSFCVQYRAGKRSRRMIIPFVLGLEKARNQARALLGRAAMGQDPLAEKRKQEQAAENTLRSITEEYFRREGKTQRSGKAKRATLERLILPKLGAHQIDDVKRNDVVRLLDKVEDENGPVMADRVFSILSRLFSWHASRSEFRSPVVRGMRRSNPTERARTRVLTDDELRAVWNVAEQRGDVFSYLVRFLLLTAARRTEAANMSWGEIEGADWTVPASRYKTKHDHLIPLSAKALALLDSMPRIGPGDWAFSTNGAGPLTSFSAMKLAFDEAAGVTNWRIHDLRRTARSLMSRAKIDADVAERCLGHVIRGVRGVYDRHSFYEEKRHAFETLAAQIERIVDPQPNVTALRPSMK